jgi:hypothetical protein
VAQLATSWPDVTTNLQFCTFNFNSAFFTVVKYSGAVPENQTLCLHILKLLEQIAQQWV